MEERKILFRELRCEILRQGYYAQDVADAIGISKAAMSARLNGKTAWTMQDVYEICDLLRIPYEKIPFYFPKKDVQA